MGIFTSKSVRKIRKAVKKKPSFLKDLVFPRTENGNAMAPFVSPIEDGRVMKEKGKVTNIVIAPNIAPKHILDPKDMFEREAGDPAASRADDRGALPHFEAAGAQTRTRRGCRFDSMESGGGLGDRPEQVLQQRAQHPVPRLES